MAFTGAAEVGAAAAAAGGRTAAAAWLRLPPAKEHLDRSTDEIFPGYNALISGITPRVPGAPAFFIDRRPS